VLRRKNNILFYFREVSLAKFKVKDVILLKCKLTMQLNISLVFTK